jgi:hypothetical protein
MKKALIIPVLALLLASVGAHAQTAPATTKYENRKQEALAKLPRDKADLLKKAVADEKAKSQNANLKIKVARKELRGLLTTEPFNKDAYLKKAAEVTKLESEKFTARAEAIAEIAPKFSATERKIISSAFDRHFEKDGNIKKDKIS